MRKKGMLLFFTVLAVVVTGGLVVWNIQDRQMYYPSYSEPSARYLAEKEEFYTEVAFSGEDGQRYVGWMHGDPEAKRPVVLLFGGNGMSAAATFAYIDARDWWSRYGDAHFVMVDYPGYGLSTGNPSEQSIYAMALAAYDHIARLENVDREHIYVMGFSLGTTAAVYLGAERECAGILLLAPFDNGVNLANQHYPYFQGPLRLLVKNQLPSDEYAPLVEEDVLLIASKDDEAVGIQLSERLADQFPREPDFKKLSALGHNDIFFDEEVMEMVRGFLMERK